MSVSVLVKWKNATYPIDWEVAGGVISLKNALSDLTAVPADRQKLMSKGWKGILKDDADVSTLDLKPGMNIVMLGSNEVPIANNLPIQFLEEMSAQQRRDAGRVLPQGFDNLGNTCYMNAVLQCLRFLPGVQSALPGTTGLLESFRSLVESGDTPAAKEAVMRFLLNLRREYPQFAEQSRNGGYAQQDAEEFYGAVMAAQNSTESRPLDDLLGLELEEQLTCDEAPEEAPVKRREHTNKLTCLIQGGSGSKKSVDHLHEGISLALEGTVEKFAASLNRDAVWTKRQRIAKVPKVLCIHFQRFFWKATPDSRDHTGVKCKILRAVNFPETMDLYDLCNDSLKEVLKARRDRKLKQDDAALEAAANPEAANEEEAMDVDDEELRAAIEMSLREDEPEEFKYLPTKFTGKYELCGVVSHKGRSADSGHYMAYVRIPPPPSNKSLGDTWVRFDDNKVTELSIEDVKDLRGGGDRDMVYMAYYRMRE